MSDRTISKAARLLIEARRTGVALAELPADCRPKNVSEAHAVQDEVNRELGEPIGGWKANAPPGGETQRGAIFERVIFASPARIPASIVPLLGVEAEIAFRFLKDLPPRTRDYGRDEIGDAVAAFAAIEVVDARMRDYNKIPLLDRLADNICNGAFVHGETVGAWRKLPIDRLRVRLQIDGRTIADKIGGHPIDDPVGPAVALVNHLRTHGGVKAGQFVTTGSCTGIEYAKPGQTVTASFDGLGSAEVTFAA
jgi:2-keto-4-pentenoate hydratase